MVEKNQKNMPCNNMFSVKGRLVPCGRCYDCVKVHRNAWTVRNLIEYEHCARAYFITLTYDDENISSLAFCDVLNSYIPDIKHYQMFIHYLRKYLTTKDCTLRYFISHEFGSQTLRPHYHVIIYLSKDIQLKNSKIRSIWKRGNVEIDMLNQARVHYTTKYVNMSFRSVSEKYVEYMKTHVGGCVSPQQAENAEKLYLMNKYSFIRMSTRPAIGFQLLNNKIFVDYIRRKTFEDMAYPSLSYQGQVFPLPRFYIKKIFTDEERKQLNEDADYKYFQRQNKKAKELNVSIVELPRLYHEQSIDKFNAIRKSYFAKSKL